MATTDTVRKLGKFEEYWSAKYPPSKSTKAQLPMGKASAEFCMYGYTQRTFTDATTHYFGVHTATGIEVFARTREGAVKALATVERKQTKIKEAIAFLKSEGYKISIPV
jgi:hypothetical protein